MLFQNLVDGGPVDIRLYTGQLAGSAQPVAQTDEAEQTFETRKATFGIANGSKWNVVDDGKAHAMVGICDQIATTADIVEPFRNSDIILKIVQDKVSITLSLGVGEVYNPAAKLFRQLVFQQVDVRPVIQHIGADEIIFLAGGTVLCYLVKDLTVTKEYRVQHYWCLHTIILLQYGRCGIFPDGDDDQRMEKWELNSQINFWTMRQEKFDFKE